MDARAENLADRFHQAREELITTIEECTSDQMQARCHGEQCTVAALASHVAGVNTLVADWVRKAANGEALPDVTMDDVNAINAEQTSRDADRNKDDILQDLRKNGDEAEKTVRQLSDAQLDRTSPFRLLGGNVTTQQLVENILIGDVEGHLASIKSASNVNA